MMQQVISALCLPALPATLSGMLLALAAFLAGAVLLSMMIATAVKLTLHSRAQRVIVSTSKDPEER